MKTAFIHMYLKGHTYFIKYVNIKCLVMSTARVKLCQQHVFSLSQHNVFSYVNSICFGMSTTYIYLCQHNIFSYVNRICLVMSTEYVQLC